MRFPSCFSISKPRGNELIPLYSNTPCARNPLSPTILPVHQHNVPTNISDPRIRSFFLFRYVSRSIENRLQHPHRMGMERRRPCRPFRLAKCGAVRFQMFDRLYDSVGKDREKSEHQRLCNNGHGYRDLIRVLKSLCAPESPGS